MGIWADGNGFKRKQKSGWYKLKYVVQARKFLRKSRLWLASNLLAVFLALFMADLCVWLQVTSNTELNTCLMAAFLIFAGDLVGLTMADASYPLSFVFWIDIVGTISIVFDLPLIYGVDASKPIISSRGRDAGDRDVVLPIAAGAFAFMARGGRLFRVSKILRYLPSSREKRDELGAENTKLARDIAKEVTSSMATRVAFVTIVIALAVSAFSMFEHPLVDDSSNAWMDALSLDARDYDEAALRYDSHHNTENKRLMLHARAALTGEIGRLSLFYHAKNYGPFHACIGEAASTGFLCNQDDEKTLHLHVSTWFETPARPASILFITEGRLQLAFNIAEPQRLAAIASMGLTAFVILVVIVFSTLLLGSVTSIALQPLERMLSTIRDRCAQIFALTTNLQHDSSMVKELTEDEDKRLDATDVSNEFLLLEKTVAKLVAIADLANRESNELAVTGAETQQDVLRLNLAGVHVPSTQATTAHNRRKSTAVNRRMTVRANRGSAWTWDRKTTGESIDVDDVPDVFAATKALEADIRPEVLQSLRTWDFDAFSSLTIAEACAVASHTTLSLNVWHAWASLNIDHHRAIKFVGACSSKYNPNPFHNWWHAVDVCWSLCRYMQLMDSDALLLGEMTQFWLMIAALGHDLGHEGLNNQFLVATSHRLALMYNDKSPLENMHCASLFQILADDKSAVFKTVEKLEYKEVRKGMISAILHTDVTKHNDMVRDVSIFSQMNEEVISAADDEEMAELLSQDQNREIIVAMLLHVADIGNPMKPWVLCQSLANLVMQEFFEQGDKEKLAGIPVGIINDRNKVVLPNAQIGFIEFIIAPMVEAVVKVFPTLDCLATNTGANIRSWYCLWKDQMIPTEDAMKKTKARVDKVCERMATLEDVGSRAVNAPLYESSN
jgi:hypothetical protein